MAGNPIKNLLIVGSIFLVLIAGISVWLSWRDAEKRRKAFALHEHEKREPVQQPCLVLQVSRIMKGILPAAIQDCLLLGPEGNETEVLEVKLRNGLSVKESPVPQGGTSY